MERFIIATLTRRGRLTAQAIAAAHLSNARALPSRSFMSSLNRALRKLERASVIQQVGRDGPRGWAMRHEDRAATAYHEAGHAVVGRALAIPVKTVRIESAKVKNKTAGHVQRGKPQRLLDLTKAELRKEAVAIFAGAAAERNFLRSLSKHRNSVHEGALDDNKHIYRIVGLIVGLAPFDLSHFESYKEERAALKAKATKLVETHWPDIERVAEYLIDEGTLTGDDLDFVLSKRGRARQFQ